MKQIIASVFFLRIILYYWEFRIKFDKNRTTLTYSCQRNSQRKNEIIIFKKIVALLILIVISFTLGYRIL